MEIIPKSGPFLLCFCEAQRCFPLSSNSGLMRAAGANQSGFGSQGMALGFIAFQFPSIGVCCSHSFVF